MKVIFEFLGRAITGSTTVLLFLNYFGAEYIINDNMALATMSVLIGFLSIWSILPMLDV